MPSEKTKTTTMVTAPGTDQQVVGQPPAPARNRFLLFVGILTLCFAWPLYNWVRFSFEDTLYSHTILIPVISWYLINLKSKGQGAEVVESSKLRVEGDGRATLGRTAVFVLFSLGLVLLLTYVLAKLQGWKATPGAALCLQMSAYVLFVIGGFVFFHGTRKAKAAAFPLAFLVFSVPFPRAVEHGIEVFFQYTSAEAANVMMNLAGIPYLREGLFFKIPGITIKVAEECSGIRSSLVLFITSLLAGYIFLKTPWKRGLLAFLVIPLAIIRNGFRITTIAYLCSNYDSSWIDSPLHHRGGPIFFALSLIPFFAILFWLRRSEKASTLSSQPPTG